MGEEGGGGYLQSQYFLSFIEGTQNGVLSNKLQKKNPLAWFAIHKY
jgi:hypothetical protein